MALRITWESLQGWWSSTGAAAACAIATVVSICPETEALLMEQFQLNPGEVLTREMLYIRVWGSVPACDTNVLGVYVGYLRRKMHAAGIGAALRTVRGVGYVLEVERRAHSPVD